MKSPAFWLTLTLRIGGITTCLAVFAIVLPVEWMAAVHAWLGLGTLPRAPIVDYLARSVSGLYAIQGALLLLLATDVRRYRPVIVFLAGAGALFGAVIVGIDLHAPMAAEWTASEGPLIIVLSGVIGWLCRQVRKAEVA